MEGVVFGLDIGSTKICALVGEVVGADLKIIGMGLEPARGIRKGMVVNVNEAAFAIARAVEKAEHTSGYKLSRAIVGISGEHIASQNNQGAVAVGNKNDGVTADDVTRALDAAQAIPVPHNRQIMHLLPRNFSIDSQEGVKSPIGMHGFRLEVDAHIVTAATPAIQNLTKCADEVGLQIEELVLNGLASGEAVLTEAEKEMGVIVADLGGGTTDLALYSEGAPWFTKTLPIGGYHIANDIAIGLRVPFEVGEEIKLKYGDCRPDQIPASTTFSVEPFGGEKIHVGHRDLAQVVEARVEEIFQMILQAIKDSNFSGLLPAGIVITGGSSQLRGMADIATKVLGVPARIALPRNLQGLVDNINTPGYATSIGLLRWAMSEHQIYRPSERRGELKRRLSGFFRSLLPDS